MSIEQLTPAVEVTPEGINPLAAMIMAQTVERPDSATRASILLRRRLANQIIRPTRIERSGQRALQRNQ